MTQEDKELLLKDLSARLAYGVIISVKDINNFQFDGTLQVIGKNWCRLNILDPIKKAKVKNETIPLNHIYIKPYLRPMSSMTEEEKKEMHEKLSPNGTAVYKEEGISTPISHYGDWIPYEYMSRIIDWLNAHHFDFRNLIERGLAIEVTEENNPYK